MTDRDLVDWQPEWTPEEAREVDEGVEELRRNNGRASKLHKLLQGLESERQRDSVRLVHLRRAVAVAMKEADKIMGIK
jgi:hypothetical protein